MAEENDLFESFGIKVKSIEKTAIQQPGVDILKKINDQMTSVKSLFFTDLRKSYLNAVYSLAEEKGRFVYVCVRCMKPIYNLNKLIKDPFSNLLYGKGCYSKILNRLNSLVYKYESGVSIQTAEDVQDFECISCNRIFPASFNNIKSCGVTTKCCFCCDANTLLNKNIRCDFEINHNIKVIF